MSKIDISGYNVTSTLRFAVQSDPNSDKVIEKLRWIGVSAARYIRIDEDERGVFFRYSDDHEVALVFNEDADFTAFKAVLEDS
ncbi:MAG: hypothetical protein QNI90_03320 [Dinoroseobacter sp.]|nr:hypothetical protein [Dinoroseobacter sp.]